MVDEVIRAEYQVTIGIECHVQLKTASKLFSAAGNDAREAPPNSLVSHIDFGLPGALPVMNQQALYLAAKAAFALNAVPQKFSKFDRKHYFYPDLPMGYQITQFDEPIVIGGHVDVLVNGVMRTIGITRAHLEADAGKSTHPTGSDFSLVDLNRAGTPLLEIVSEPDMHTAAEARAYAHELYLRMRYAEVSDCNLYYGNMRFDVNVSVSKTMDLGTRTETKNLNSFKAVEKAVEYEVERQIARLETGESIIQETRGWDDTNFKTFSQRSKENADDYRYMPDPDLPPMVIDDSYIAQVKSAMPEMPDVWRLRLQQLGLDSSQTESLLDAGVEFAEQNYLGLIETAIQDLVYARVLSNWLVNIDIPFMRTQPAQITNDRQSLYKAVYTLLATNKLSSTNAKALISKLVMLYELPSAIEAFAEAEGLMQVSNQDEIAAIVSQVLATNPKAADDVKNGEDKAIGFLVGQVMKQSKGTANPTMAQELIRQQLAS
jgi:aspartyl-tRNA(Asn)/glutamyl-tRNA(Gln) amidotransferase subunit B